MTENRRNVTIKLDEATAHRRFMDADPYIEPVAGRTLPFRAELRERSALR